MKSIPARLLWALFLLAIFGAGVAFGRYSRRFNLLADERIAAAPAPTPQPVVTPPHHLLLYALIGQSNMSGYAPLPDEISAPDDVYLFGNDYQWHAAQEPADSPVGQVDPVSLDPDAGYGPSTAFGAAMHTATGQPIGLIPCARAAVTLYAWRRDTARTSLYGSCLHRIAVASEHGDLAGLLIYHGEADSASAEVHPNWALSPETYAEEFERWIADWRSDLDAPLLPVVFAQIGTHGDLPDLVHWELVQAQQARIDLPCAVMIQTDDLKRSDRAHLTAASYDMLGERFAAAMVSLARCE